MLTCCGADCSQCGYGKNMACKGCEESRGCPLGKPCFVYRYIQTGGREAFEAFKIQLMEEINALHIPGMPEVKELFALNGAFVNLAYPLPSGERVKFLEDREIYLGTQLECLFASEDDPACFGVLAGLDFIMVVSYGANLSDPQLLLYKKR